MINPRRLAAAVATAAAMFVASSGLVLAQSNSGSVTISDFQFTPATLQVSQGTTVTWTNNGPSSHTSTSDAGAWDSGTLSPGKSFSLKFNTPGSFTYHCSIHPSMKASITVTAAQAAAPAASSTSGGAASPSASAASRTSASVAASPAPSAMAAPAQLPRTGGGGGSSSNLPAAGGLLALASLASGTALWWRRHRRAQ